MDDLGDDSVQLVIRISRETFEMWMRSHPRRARGAESRNNKSAASSLADTVRSGDGREVGGTEAEECGWTQITLASTDLEGIQSRLAEQGVLFQVNERFDGDIDVWFQASNEDVIREALADIIANEALSQNEQELGAENCAELDGSDTVEQDPEGSAEKREDVQEHDAIEDQIAEAKQCEASREEARTEQARERTMSQGLER